MQKCIQLRDSTDYSHTHDDHSRKLTNAHLTEMLTQSNESYPSQLQLRVMIRTMCVFEMKAICNQMSTRKYFDHQTLRQTHISIIHSKLIRSARFCGAWTNKWSFKLLRIVCMCHTIYSPFQMVAHIMCGFKTKRKETFVYVFSMEIVNEIVIISILWQKENPNIYLQFNATNKKFMTN